MLNTRTTLVLWALWSVDRTCLRYCANPRLSTARASSPALHLVSVQRNLPRSRADDTARGLEISPRPSAAHVQRALYSRPSRYNPRRSFARGVPMRGGRCGIEFGRVESLDPLIVDPHSSRADRFWPHREVFRQIIRDGHCCLWSSVNQFTDRRGDPAIALPKGRSVRGARTVSRFNPEI